MGGWPAHYASDKILSVMDEAYLRRRHRLWSARDGNCFPVQPRVRLQSRHVGQMDGVGRRTHETLRESHGMTRQSACCDMTDPSQRNRETDPLRVYMRSEVENSLQ